MLHLKNGIRDSVVFIHDGIDMACRPHLIGTVRQASTRFAPAFLIKDGRIGVDWDFYAQASDEDRESIVAVLWAAGVLTSERLGTFAVVGDGDYEAHWGPSIGGKRLFFAENRAEDAQSFADIIPRMMKKEHEDFKALAGQMARDARGPEPVSLEIVQCTRLAEFVTIGPLVTA